MIIRGILDNSLSGQLCIRGFAPIKELAKISQADFSYQRNPIEGREDIITFLETENRDKIIHYQGVEAYPITIEEALAMNYVKELKQEKKSFIFDKIHTSSWDEWNTLSEHFFLKKRKQFFNEIIDENSFDLIYFDAFGARVQPELWTEEIFQKMYNALKINGKLVTYSSKGSARRAIQAVGFSVEKIPGPLGKREMLRATKI